MKVMDKHKNIINLLGVCTQEGEVMLLFKLQMILLYNKRKLLPLLETLQVIQKSSMPWLKDILWTLDFTPAYLEEQTPVLFFFFFNSGTPFFPLIAT